MIAKCKRFTRGYQFSNFQGQPQDNLVQMTIPGKVILPLKQGFGAEVAPVVEPGHKVEAGQIVGRDDQSISSPVLSSVNGKIVQIEEIDNLGTPTGAVIIESDGTSDWRKLQGYSSTWENLPAEKLHELIYLSGTAALDNAGIPTKFKSSIIAPDEVEDVIVHGVGSEVHNPSLNVLLRQEKLTHFVEGLKILKKLMAGAQFHVALNKSCKGLIKDLQAASNWLDLRPLAPRYPLDRDEVLVATLLGREFPYGYSAANIGVIVLSVQTVLHVYEAVVQGKPLIERTIALCGPGFKENPHVNIRIGTPLEHITRAGIQEDKELRFVRNSCLTGEIFSDISSPIDRTCDAVVALVEDREREFNSFVRPGLTKDSYCRTFASGLFKKDSETFKKGCGTNLHGEARPCIFCSYCEEVCPVAIIPHLLFHYVERDLIDEALPTFRIFNCIECNLCSYVCPSKIPLAEYIKMGKDKLVDEGFSLPVPDMKLKAVQEYNSLKQSSAEA